MANLTRCDECKRLSDEPQIGYIGRHHSINHYRDVIIVIACYRDLCGDCIKKIVANHSIQQNSDE